MYGQPPGAMEWVLPNGLDAPSSLDGYVVSFMQFHKRGLMAPAHGLL